MDFKTASKIGHYISKDYAEDLFELLVKYRDISASEAASRLNIHITTAQDFLEGLASLDILSKEEVSERKRPYFRYTLQTPMISIEINLKEIIHKHQDDNLDRKIKEKKHNNARFTTGRSNDFISSVSFWVGDGRSNKEHRINFTTPQGTFLFHLPFPDAAPVCISDIMRKAEVDNALSVEILDIVGLLEKHDIIEVV